MNEAISTPDLSILSISGSGNRMDILSLAECILLRIISHLDLRSIAHLSQTHRVFLKVSRSEDLWKRISRALVGPWIHRPQLISKQTPKSNRPQNPAIPSDWTEDPNCVPVSHFTRKASQSQANTELFASWYDFATHLIIPHFNFLGWQISNKPAECEIILVTYDIFSGRIVLEQVACHNLVYRIHDQPEDKHCQSQDLAAVGLPPWVPTDRIHLESDGLHYIYKISPELPNEQYAFEIFTPVYSPSSILTISILGPLPRSQSSPISRNIYKWQDFMLNRGIPKIRHAEKIIAPRSSIVLRKVCSQDTNNFLTNPKVASMQLRSFTLDRGPERRDFYPIDGPITCHLNQSKAITDGLWVGLNCDRRGERRILFGKIIIERQCNLHRQLRFMRLTGGRPEFVWQVGIHNGRPIPALTLDEALAVDFGTSSVDARWIKGEIKKKVGEHSIWEGVEIQFIQDPEVKLNESNINQIRIKSRTDQKVTSYYRVQFDT